jgi:fucose permease
LTNSTTPAQEETAPARNSRGLTVGIILLGLLLLGGLVAATIFLLQPGAPTEAIRDLFIIFVAFEFLIIGVALVLLLVQLARLVNLLQNEIGPILDSASEAAQTMRGTSRFLSDRLVAPVVKISAGVAGFRRALELLRFWGRSRL